MQISKIHALRVSIYDKAGMIHVNPLSKDFAATANGTPLKKPTRLTQQSDVTEVDFESELENALENLRNKPIDYHA